MMGTMLRHLRNALRFNDHTLSAFDSAPSRLASADVDTRKRPTFGLVWPGATELVVGAALASLSVGCSCESLVKDAPSEQPSALSVHCACQIEARSATGEVKQQFSIDPTLCVPESYEAAPSSYCDSAEVREFLAGSTLGALDTQIPDTCSRATIQVTCQAVSGEEAGQAAASCEGTCPEKVCDTTTCSEVELLNGTCACTQGAACGTASSMAVCVPSLEGELISPPDEPLTLGHGTQATRSTLFAMPGGWLPGSTFHVEFDFSSCAGSSCERLADESTSEVNGTFELLGRPCPFANCELGFHTKVSLSDFSLDLDTTHNFTGVTLEVLGAQGAIPASPSGFGFIMPGKLLLQASAFDNGVKRVLTSQVNDFPVLFTLDWQNRRITIPSVNVSFPGGEGSISVSLDGTFAPSVAETLDANLFVQDVQDTDQDGIGDDVDNCPLVPNSAQEAIASPVLFIQDQAASCMASVPPTPVAEDVCFGGPVSVTSNLGSTLPLGVSSIVWTATDSRGSSATATQTLRTVPLLAGANSVVLNDRAQLSSGDVVALGAQPTRAGTDTVLTSIFSRSALDVRDRSRVLGQLTSGGSIRLGSRVQVPSGGLHPNTLPSFGTFPELEVVPFTVGTSHVQLEPGKTRTLSPGRFGRIQVASRAVLTLAPGDYYMDALGLEPDARVNLSGPTRFFVKSSLTLRGTLGGGSAFPVVTYNGTNQVALERNFTGQVRAPRAKLVMGSGNQLIFRGSFFAKDIEVSPGASLSCQSGAP